MSLDSNEFRTKLFHTEVEVTLGNGDLMHV